MKEPVKLQTQAVEAIGRGHLVSKMIREGIGVSLPLWDDGIDLIAHVRNLEDNRFEARPLQLKVSTNTYVGLYEKYAATPHLRMVFTWAFGNHRAVADFVLPYEALHSMFRKHGHLETSSWIDKRGFSTSRASKEKLDVLTGYEVGVRTLRELLFSA